LKGACGWVIKFFLENMLTELETASVKIMRKPESKQTANFISRAPR
jgi:hypothetical protein